MINPSNDEDDLPEETPEALRGIAERLQHAIDELLAVRAEAEGSSDSVALTEAADRALSESAQAESDQLAHNGTRIVSGMALAAGHSLENVDPDSPVASAMPLKASAIEQAPSDSARANFDRRLYLPAADGWQVRIKSGTREYCFYQTPGEDWFHGLVDGELFLQYGEEKLCLNCAFRHGILTDNRLFWQTGRHHARLPNISFSQSSNPHDRKADMNQSIEGLLRDQYRVDDVRAITRYLIEHGTFEFPTLKSGLFSAAVAHSQDQQYTGYQNVWVRDNIHIAYHFHVLGEHDRAVRAVASITQFEHTQRDKLRNIIVGKVDPQNVMLRPHIRFDGDHLIEVSEQWAHAQNDALGYWLWLASKLALAGHWQPTGEDIKLMSNFVQYFEAIQFWQDEDNGHWEEARKVEASSLGAVVAGLTALRDYFVTMASAQMPQGATNSFIDQTCRRAESLIERGQAALKAILPNECIQDDPGKQRSYDAALLFLIYPLQIVEGEMAEKIISNVVTHLLGEFGIRRYLGDSYWCADYKKLLDPNNRTVDVSHDMSARDSLLQPGGEAQWCLFDPILSVIHGQRFQQTGDAGQLELQTRHLNRSLRQLSGEGGSYPPLRCPESNYRENGVWGPNDITPLLWTQANLRLALHFMEQSLAVGGSSRTA